MTSSLPPVPGCYICINCKQIGTHWIMDCTFYKNNLVHKLRDLLLKDFARHNNLLKNVDVCNDIPRDKGKRICDIINDWMLFHGKNNCDETEMVIMGIKKYFNEAVKVSLLYENERKQYNKVFQDKTDLYDKMDRIYGLEHLLRLFVKLPHFISMKKFNYETRSLLKNTVQSIVQFVFMFPNKY